MEPLPAPHRVHRRPPDFPEQPDPGFKDTFVPRLGAEWRLPVGQEGRWTLAPRLGVAFEPTPAPEQVSDQNLLDSDRVITAVGVGIGWDTLRLDLVGQWHHMAARTHTKDLERLDPRILEDNPGAPSISHQGEILFWGLELGLEL